MFLYEFFTDVTYRAEFVNWIMNGFDVRSDSCQGRSTLYRTILFALSNRYCCWSFQVQITKTKTKESVSIRMILKPAKYFHYHYLCCLNTSNVLVRSADNLEHKFSFQLGKKKMLSVCRYHDIF